nr:THAP domain-containing protein 11-like [Dermacentor andersoni]
MPGCCVPQCSNHSRNGWRMFHFPRDPKRRLLWLVRVKRDKWQPTNSSCVCSAHFEASSFEQNRADGWKKLKPNAVPTVFPFKELPKERRPPRERNAHVPALFSDDAAAHNSSREVRNVLPSTTQEFSPADSSSDGEINERLAATETNNANGQLTSTPRDARLQETAIVTATQPLDSEAAELRKKIADLTAANNKLRQHHNESKNTVKKLQMQVRKLQKEATNFSRNTKFLNEDQIRALSRNNNHVRTKYFVANRGHLLMHFQGRFARHNCTVKRALSSREPNHLVEHSLAQGNLSRSAQKAAAICELRDVRQSTRKPSWASLHIEYFVDQAQKPRLADDAIVHLVRSAAGVTSPVSCCMGLHRRCGKS